MERAERETHIWANVADMDAGFICFETTERWVWEKLKKRIPPEAIEVLSVCDDNACRLYRARISASYWSKSTFGIVGAGQRKKPPPRWLVRSREGDSEGGGLKHDC